MIGLPTIRLEFEGMRHAMLAALGRHHDDIERVVDQEIRSFIETYDLADTVRRNLGPILDEIIKDVVTRHFRFGEGRDAIESALTESLRQSDQPK